MSATIVDWIPVVVAVASGALLANSTWIRNRSHWLLHSKVRDITNMCCLRPIKWMLDSCLPMSLKQELFEFSLGEIFASLLFLIILIVRFLIYYDKLDKKNRPVRAVFFRALGELNFMTLAFVLLPVTKHSLWLPLLGISYERAIKYHRIWAVLTILLMGVHGFGMWVEYAQNNVFHEVLWFRINPSTGWSNLSGLLSFACGFAMMLFAIPYIRRNNYEIFYYVHIALAPAVFVFAGLHMPLLLEWMAPAIALYALDYGLRLWYKYYRYNHTVKVAHYDFIYPSSHASSSPASPQYIVLKLHVSGSKTVTPFHPGQFYLLNIPSVSFWETHPFSVSEVKRIAFEKAKDMDMNRTVSDSITELSFHIKIMSPQSWTHRLSTLLLSLSNESSTHLPTIFVDGPFGYSSTITRSSASSTKISTKEDNLDKETELLLIGGGIGGTPCLATLADYVSSCSLTTVDDGDNINGNYPYNSVKFLWICRGQELFGEFSPLLSDAVRVLGQDSIMLYDTNSKNTNVVTTTGGSEDESRNQYSIACRKAKSSKDDAVELEQQSEHDKPDIVVHRGRPALHELLSEVVRHTVNSGSHVKVVDVMLCGPQMMVEEIQAILSTLKAQQQTSSVAPWNNKNGSTQIIVRTHTETFQL